jgi:hypothetical protein
MRVKFNFPGQIITTCFLVVLHFNKYNKPDSASSPKKYPKLGDSEDAKAGRTQPDGFQRGCFRVKIIWCSTVVDPIALKINIIPVDVLPPLLHEHSHATKNTPNMSSSAWS